MMEQNTIIYLLAVAGIFSSFFVTGRTRNGRDVLLDLSKEEDERTVESPFDTERHIGRPPSAKHEWATVVYDPARDKEKYTKFLPLVFAVIFPVMLFISGKANPSFIIFSLVLGLASGYLAGRNIVARARVMYRKEIEFFLPVIMERVVMAVQAGLDVIPALKAIIDLDSKGSAEQGKSKTDPVTALLATVVRLTEAGLSFEQGLKEVASNIDCVAVKHAFIHLSVAQKEGGEVVGPLKELSDSTQLYYQDAIEEEIAKMPVKATMPLLCTFAGLIIVFITSPLIQVLSMTAKAMPK